MPYKFKIIDHTGDSVVYHDTFESANQSFEEMTKEFMAYVAGTNTLIHSLGAGAEDASGDASKQTQEVIFHRKLIGG